MNIIIHRGTHQIGGSITEISTNNTRIFIDFGLELYSQQNENATKNIEIEGLTKGTPNCEALLFTHYHGDHIGMISSVLPNIPFYMGEAAKEIYSLYQKHIKNGVSSIINNAKTFFAGQKFVIKDIAITPIAVDHSAYDAYMLLIEADGKRIPD